MSFRPTLEHLDSRDLMTVTTVGFALPDGTVAAGSFTFPTTQIDASLSGQAIPISDLTFSAGVWAVQVDDYTTTPTANFANGQFLGVTVGAVAPGSTTAVHSIALANGHATAVTTSGQTVEAAVGVVGVPADVPVHGGQLPDPVIPPVRRGDLDPLAVAQLKVDYDFLLLQLKVIQDRVDAKIEQIDDLDNVDDVLRAQLPTASPSSVIVITATIAANEATIARLQIDLFFLQLEYTSLYNTAVLDYRVLQAVLPADELATLTAPPKLVLPADYLPPDGTVIID
jgi:hypothetical protein